MLVLFEIGSSVLLLLSLILPYQNFTILCWFGGGLLLLWASVLALSRTRHLLNFSLFFYCCLLLTFFERATFTAGPLMWWYAVILWTLWGVLLWFYTRGDRSVAALFVCIT